MSSDKSFATMQLVTEENLQIFAIQEQQICHLCAAQNPKDI
jgi:ribosomal protein L40E